MGFLLKVQAVQQNRPHPALPPETRLSQDNRALEMRTYWGQNLLAVNHYDKPSSISIGEAKGCDFFISSEGLPVASFPLVRMVDDEYTLTFSDDMNGEIEIDEHLASLDIVRASPLCARDEELESCSQVTLPMLSRVLIHWGGVTFALRFVAPATPVKSSPFEGIDFRYVNMLLGSTFFHLAAVVMLLVYPYDISMDSDLFDQEENRFNQFILRPPEPDEAVEKKLDEIRKKINKNDPEIQRPDPKKDRLSKLRPTPRPPSFDQRRREVTQRFSSFMNASLMNSAGSGGGLSGSLTQVIGSRGAPPSSAGIAGLGIEFGERTGGFGGPGTSRSIGNISTSPPGRTPGIFGGQKWGRRKAEKLAALGPVKQIGELPREVIQGVINENKQQVRYCYEYQLQKSKDLEGRVMVRWIIGATGRVKHAKVRESTLGSQAVEKCIEAKIRTWRFPAPSGGGVVEVNYPFVFRAG